MKLPVLWFAGLIMCGVALTHPSSTLAATDTYKNDKYSFQLSVPTDVRLCTEMPPSPDHGPTLLLKRSIQCDRISSSVPKISMSAYYNAAEDQNLRELKNAICPHPNFRSHLLRGVVLNSSPSVTCVNVKTGGRIEVWVLAQDRSNNDIDLWIDYEFGLLTTQARLGKDLSVFRSVLHGTTLKSN